MIDTNNIKNKKMRNDEIYHLLSRQAQINRELPNVNPMSDEGIILRGELEEINQMVANA